MKNRLIINLKGEIKGELKLGKFTHDDAKEREKRTLRWLDEIGW